MEVKFVSSNQKLSLLMNEFTYRLPPKEKSASRETYSSDLEENISLMYSKPYPVILKSLLHLIFTIYGPKTSPEFLQLIEQVFKANPDQAYMHFFYQIEQLFSYQRMPHSYVPHTIKIELQPNINRFFHSVTATSTGTNIRLNLLAPTRKERLICEHPIVPAEIPLPKKL